MIDTESKRVVATIPVGDGPQDVTWAPDGRFAYVADVDADTVSVIDVATMTVTATVPTGDAPTSVAVLPNGREAYVTNLHDGTLTVLHIGR
jgi:YVTN family beta-propeller protein